MALFQTTPDHMHFTKGAEHLTLTRLGPKGLFRWSAGCCGAPMANTLPRPQLPFVGIQVGRFEDPAALGPVRTHGNGKGAWPQPVKDRGMVRAIATLFWRAARTKLSGRGGQTPFFDAAGEPVATPIVLTLEERKTASKDG